MLTIDANVWVAAFDGRDRFHAASIAFLRAAANRRLWLHDPVFVIVEVACALTRRSGHSAPGDAVARQLRAHPALSLHPLDEPLLERAQAIGVDRRLRGADALYAATAAVFDAPLITWDAELVERAQAQTPDHWITANT